MKEYGKVRSAVEPEPVKVDEFSVWVHSNIEPINETKGEESFTGFEYDMVRYEKDEYIQLMVTQNRQLEDAVIELAQITLGENSDSTELSTLFARKITEGKITVEDAPELMQTRINEVLQAETKKKV